MSCRSPGSAAASDEVQSNTKRIASAAVRKNDRSGPSSLPSYCRGAVNQRVDATVRTSTLPCLDDAGLVEHVALDRDGVAAVEVIWRRPVGGRHEQIEHRDLRARRARPAPSAAQNPAATGYDDDLVSNIEQTLHPFPFAHLAGPSAARPSRPSDLVPNDCQARLYTARPPVSTSAQRRRPGLVARRGVDA